MNIIKIQKIFVGTCIVFGLLSVSSSLYLYQQNNLRPNISEAAAGLDIRSLNSQIKTKYLSSRSIITNKADLKDMLLKRRNLLKKTLLNNPSEVPQYLFTQTDLAKIPGDLKEFAEKPITSSGSIALLHGHDFSSDRVYPDTYLLTSKGQVSSQGRILVFANNPKNAVTPGTQISFSGYDIGGINYASTYNYVTNPETSSIRPITSSINKTAVVIINIDNRPNSVGGPIDKDRILNIFNNPNGVNAFYKENSFGKEIFGGDGATAPDIYDGNVLKVDNPQETDCYALFADLTSKAIGLPVVNDLKNYNYVLFAFGNVGCGFGAGSVGPPNATYPQMTSFIDFTYNNAYSNLYTTSHELGHNRGSQHANSIVCPTENDISLGSVNYFVRGKRGCSKLEYGGISVMGHNVFNFTTFEKEKFGWITPGLSQEISYGQNLEYEILPRSGVTLGKLPGPIRNGGLALKIKRDTISSEYSGFFGNFVDYYVEFMTPQGFDAVSQNEASEQIKIPHVRILIGGDPTKAGTDGLEFNDVPYTHTLGLENIGDTFVDPYRGLEITLTSLTKSSAKVKVNWVSKIGLNLDINVFKPVSNTNPDQYSSDTDPFTISLRDNAVVNWNITGSIYPGWKMYRYKYPIVDLYLYREGFDTSIGYLGRYNSTTSTSGQATFRFPNNLTPNNHYYIRVIPVSDSGDISGLIRGESHNFKITP